MCLSVILGIVQGLTEFLPVSSSGHLFLISSVFGGIANKIAFFVWLHLATLFAVVVFFSKDILMIFKKKGVVLSIVVATIVTSVLAIFIDKYLGGYFGNRYFIFAGFMVTTCLLFLSRYYIGGEKSLDGFTQKEALFFGIAQAIAVFPGISRSGITIAFLMSRGFSAEVSFKLSFLASVPIILGAFIYESSSIVGDNFTAAYIGGFFSAFLGGLAALKILQRIIKNKHLYYFAYYCALIGIVSLVI